MFNCRRVEYCPPYFEHNSFAVKYGRDKLIIEWILDNLSSRFYVGKTIELTSDQSFDTRIKVGFEDKKDMSYFVLACPFLSS